MAQFDIGEHVICSITVRDEDGALQDAATSMKITINRLTPNYAEVQAAVAMTGGVGADGTGLYHHDMDTASAVAGDYEIKYTAVDGARTTIQKDTFSLA